MERFIKYIGDGAAFPGIPARDLSAEDVEKYVVPTLAGWKIEDDPVKWLEGTGLYKSTKGKSKKEFVKKDGE